MVLLAKMKSQVSLKRAVPLVPPKSNANAHVMFTANAFSVCAARALGQLSVGGERGADFERQVKERASKISRVLS